MSPRDLGQSRVLIACPNPIETIDISEYLETRGWVSPVMVSSASEGAHLLDTRTELFALTVLATPQSDPASTQVIRMCANEDCPIIVVDAAVSTAHAGHIAMLSRPFIDADLDDALTSLGFVLS